MSGHRWTSYCLLPGLCLFLIIQVEQFMFNRLLSCSLSLIIICSSSLLLNGCTNSNQLNTIAEHQAKKINKNLPIKSGNYTFALANGINSTIKMTILSHNQEESNKSLQSFFNKLKTQLCAESDVNNLLKEGITYHIEFNNIETNKHQQYVLSYSSCNPEK